MNSENVKFFYNDFAGKLLGDFLGGNRRLERAIRFACGELAKAAPKSVLDLGFGLGWSSLEYSNTLPDSKVLGVDISPQLTELARVMFGRRPQLEYLCQDIVDADWSKNYNGNYGACVMLDVYEHIPTAARSEFHRALSVLMADDGILVMTCPTPLHQDFLRKHQPEGLQPVDEDVTLSDLIALASDIRGEITYYDYRSLWATNDYFYVTISRSPKRGGIPERDRVPDLMGKSERLKHVRMAREILGDTIVDSILSKEKSRVRGAVKRILGK